MTDERSRRSPAELVGRAVQRLPGGDLLLSGPRAIGFVRRGRPARATDGEPSEIPDTPRGIAFTAATMLDEMAIAWMRIGRLNPKPDEVERIVTETRAAAELFRAEGWLDDPAAFHDEPPCPTDVTVRRAALRGVEYERVSFDSEYEPDERIPGRDRWLAHERNRRTRAWVVRSTAHELRPWLVNLHGFGMGRPHDMTAFRSFHYDEHGVNVIHPIFPLHGPRRLGRRSGDGVITVDPLSNVLGMSQAIWDIRRCILWARDQGATDVGVHGVSLGAYTAALLAGLVDDLACVVAGIPPADLVSVLARSMAPRTRALARENGLLGADARDVHRVVSPLALEPRLPRDSLFVYAGLGDRMSTAEQAELLWRHWDRPKILWFPSSHIGQMFLPEVHHSAREAVFTSLVGHGGPHESEGAA